MPASSSVRSISKRFGLRAVLLASIAWSCGPSASLRTSTPRPAPDPPRQEQARSTPAPETRAAIAERWRFPLGRQPARATRFMVESDSALATEVGVDVLSGGGNAVDAAVAVAFALAVVYPEAGNLGGGGFAVVRSHAGELAALDFRESAPAAARRDMFSAPPAPADTKGKTGALSTKVSAVSSRIGHSAVGVPGSVAGLWELHRRFGGKPWAALVAPALVFAERGFPIEPAVADSLAKAREKLERFAASQALFLPEGKPLAAGETLSNPALAEVLRRIAEQGRDGFYTGRTAELIAAEMKRGAGLIDSRDLATYEPRWRTPIRFEYRGYQIVSMPPPSSGGVALALIGNVLEHYDLRASGFHSREHVHLLAEAMRRAFADRNELLGDPDFVSIPLSRLLSDGYAAERKSTIGPRATPSSEVRSGIAPAEGNHTTHLAVVDAAGAAVALTTTLNDSYGSGVTVTGAGFLLNDEMDDFTTAPGQPNLYGLVQGERNAVAPGKRMLSSMAPTLVLDRAGQVQIVAGARGGPRIITSTWQVISNVIDFGMSVSDAVDAPRVHQQWQPDELALEEEGFHSTTLAGLQELGHSLRLVSEVGSSPAIVREPGGGWSAAFDPRRGGFAAGR